MKSLATLLIWGVMALALSGSAAKPDYRNPVAAACRAISFEGDPFTICRPDPKRHQIRLITYGSNGKALRNFTALRRELGKDAGRVAFAMNAGMYDWDGNPIGLYVEAGHERHPINLNDGKGNFHLKPNGIFWIDPAGPHVATTETFVAIKPAAEWATQSGPMLVAGGQLHPKISPDGPSRYSRNVVGVTAKGDTIFAISNIRVSFGKIARLMRDQFNCPNVLFLDGYVSSLWDGASGRSDEDLNIGPMVVVMEKR